jgi:beta-galactosidase beta subunit
MIVTDLDHVTKQSALTPMMKKATPFLLQTRGQGLADGRIEVEGNRVYALVQTHEQS